MSGPFLSAQSFNALGKETVRGTAAAATVFLPISPNPTLTPNLTWITDDALRGSPVKTYNKIPSVRYDDFQCKGYVFPDTFPVLMMGILGGPDTKSGTVAPYTHKIPLLNSASTGSQPPSYTVVDVDQVTETTSAAKQLAGGQLAEVQVTFATTGALNYTTKWIGNPYTEITVPTASFSTEVFIPAWSATITIGGTSVAVLEEGKFTIQRSTKSIFTLGTQAPYQNFADVIQLTGDLTFLALGTDSTLTKALALTHQVLKLKFTEPISSHTVTFQMSSAQYFNPKIVRSKEYVQVSTSFEANANTTDAASGYAPITFTAVNAQSTTY